MTELEEDEREKPFDRLTKGSVIGAAVCGLPFYFLFAAYHEGGKGLVAYISVGAIVISAWMRQDLNERVWYWATMVIIGLLHVPLIILVPWPNGSYSRAMLLPLALLDFAFVYNLIKLAEKVMGRRKVKSAEEG